ncbi:SAV_2336 N-terminal domain-related protein [Actinoplanes sp. NPDC024001]|uniref:SAV_2336 N-terminal domain-related protein n=1 Tax=Actinoplanes sp. NPDC024001 TaxID=3154598 RepID=UPI0033C40C85
MPTDDAAPGLAALAESGRLRHALRRLPGRPPADRRLHLTLVLDQSSGGGIWNQLGQEVRAMLQRLGAFRTIRVVNLAVRSDGTVGVLRLNRRFSPRSLTKLADRTGDHLILVLSDGVSGPWRDGQMSALLGHWARRAPVAILQPLPERLWRRTGLAPLPGRLSSPRPGAATAEYGFVSALRRRTLPEGAVPVPILEIEPRWLRSWASLVAGRAPDGIDAIVMPAGAANGRVATPTADVTADPADRLLSRFRGAASVPAYRLARYLSAAVPLNLAVMRIVQARMLPQSRRAHLAEVLYGGLLEPVPADAVGGAEQHFEFRPGVRDVLLSTLTLAEAGRVVTEVTGYIARHLEQTGASFTAVASAPVSSLHATLLRPPFAQVQAEVLRRVATDPEPAVDRDTSARARRRRAPAGEASTGRLIVLLLTGLAGATRETIDEIVARCRRDEITPDLIAVPGGAASRATTAEYQAAYRTLEDLRADLDVPAGRTITVPGMSDVNLVDCELYFLTSAAEGAAPTWPYWPKWEPYAALTAQLPGATAFLPHQPWQLMPIPELRTVVAALNSTMPVSHRDGDAYGDLGDQQIEWFSDQLSEYEQGGWLRVGLLHHDPAGDGRTGLRHADDFAHRLIPHLDVVLHGTGAGVHEIGYTGVPGVGPHAGFQVVDLRPGTVRVLADTAESYAFGEHWWPAGQPAPAAAAIPTGEQPTDLVSRAARAYRARYRERTIDEHPLPRPLPGDPVAGYLAVAPAGETPFRIGVCDAEPSPEVVHWFRENVVRPGFPDRDTILICRTPPGDPALREQARRQGVELLGFADFQIGSRLRRFAAQEAAKLAEDVAYPAAHYAPQPYAVLPPGEGSAWSPEPSAPGTGLLNRLREWMSAPEGQMIGVVGAAGMGKTFLLRELARSLHDDRGPLLPILVRLQDLDWREGLDQLVAYHLYQGGGAPGMDLEWSRYLLREGRVALLCDGLDDMAASTTRDEPRRWVDGWEAGARVGPGRAKVVLVSRDETLLKDALRPYAAGAVHWAKLTSLQRGDMLVFLTRKLGDARRAERRLALMRQVGGLMGPARNPRMLAFIAEIEEDDLRTAAVGDETDNVAKLYLRMITKWLDGIRGFDGINPEDKAQVVGQAVSFLARRLWESGEPALGADALGAAADVLARLAGAAAPSRRETARLLGAGTLLVRDEEYRFQFVDRSILEWLVAKEIAEQLDPQRITGRLRGLLRRELTPLVVEFLCHLVGPATARRWAQTVLRRADLENLPLGVVGAASQVLKHLDRHPERSPESRPRRDPGQLG